MAYFFHPRQQGSEHHPSQDILADAFLSALSRGMNNFDPYFGAHRRPGHGSPGGGAGCSRPRRHPQRREQTPTARDPAQAWAWWLLGGGDSSDSEEENHEKSETTAPFETAFGAPFAHPLFFRGRQCGMDSCGMKRKPSRSNSNAPPNKKKEERKTTEEKTEETTEKFNFTGRKNSGKAKTEAKKTEESKPRPENKKVDVLFVRPAPWSHVVKVDSEFGPEDVKVYVRDGRIRVEGRKEHDVSGNNDVIECLEVNRELVVPSDVDLDDLRVYFRAGGRLELSAPRRVKVISRGSTELVKNLEKMSVDDIEKDAGAAGEEEKVEKVDEKEDEKREAEKATGENTEKLEEAKDLRENCVEREEKSVSEEKKEDASDVTEEKRVEETNGDWEMVEEKNEEATMSESDSIEGVVTGDGAAVGGEDVEVIQDGDNEKKENAKITEIEEITTNPIVEEPSEVSDGEETMATAVNSAIATEAPQPSPLVVRIVSEQQQEKQLEENMSLLVMNLAGFEPRDVTVTSEAVTSEAVTSEAVTSKGMTSERRVCVRAVRETEEDGFISRRENYRSFRVPQQIKSSELTCTMGPEGNLVISASNSEN